MATIIHEPLSRHALAFVLAGGRGSRLMELTDRRAKPAVYFGGKSRIIDFALSNAVNSGIRRIAVATQYKAHSLIRHLQMGWNFFRPERNESFDILPASQRISETNWYLGTADAVYQNIDIIEPHRARFVVLLAGDHIYKMDYELMLRQHVEQRAEVTIGCLEMPRSESSGFGIMHIDDHGVIQSAPLPPLYRRANQFVRQRGKCGCPALRECGPACAAEECRHRSGCSNSGRSGGRGRSRTRCETVQNHPAEHLSHYATDD